MCNLLLFFIRYNEKGKTASGGWDSDDPFENSNSLPSQKQIVESFKFRTLIGLPHDDVYKGIVKPLSTGVSGVTHQCFLTQLLAILGRNVSKSQKSNIIHNLKRNNKKSILYLLE